MEGKSYGNSLLDRLVDALPQSPYERDLFTHYDLSEYKKAVFSDLTVLLNTRSVLDVERYLSVELSVYHYGIPDMSHFVAGNQQQQVLFQRVLQRGITHFETRLSQVQVSLIPVSSSGQRFKAEITASLVASQGNLNVSFVGVNEALQQGWTIYESSQ